MKKAVFLRTSSKPIPRVKRVAIVAEELGYETLFVGAYRDVQLKESDVWDDLSVRRVGKYYPMLNGSGVFTYISGVFHYNLSAYKLLREVKPDLIHFSDVESFLSVFSYSVFRKVNTIYNIHDNFGQRYPLPKVINSVLNFFEGLIVKFSTRTIVPEKFRADSLPKFCQKDIDVVKNTPIDPGFSKHEISSLGNIKIIFAGWLDDGRGIETLLRLAETNPKFEIHIAGEGSAKIIERISGVKNCIYHGFLNHGEVMELTKKCDFVFAHYSPHRIINIFAAPNKLAEALAVGRPVILNSETKVSKPVVEYDCGIVTAYGDLNGIEREIISLSNNGAVYKDMCRRSRDLFDASYSWEVVKQNTIDVIDNFGS